LEFGIDFAAFKRTLRDQSVVKSLKTILERDIRKMRRKGQVGRETSGVMESAHKTIRRDDVNGNGHLTKNWAVRGRRLTTNQSTVCATTRECNDMQEYNTRSLRLEFLLSRDAFVFLESPCSSGSPIHGFVQFTRTSSKKILRTNDISDNPVFKNNLQATFTFQAVFSPIDLIILHAPIASAQLLAGILQKLIASRNGSSGIGF
jgi:hypothetical protein